MSNNIKVDADKIHILNLKTIQGNIECGADTDTSDVGAHLFSFDLDNALDADRSIVAVKLKVDIKAFNSSDEELDLKGSYTHEMIFKVENLNDFLKEKEGEKLLSPILGSTLVGIAYSTIRGIIYTRTQGTSLGTVMLPVVPPLRLMGLEKLIEEQKDSEANETKEEKTDKIS